MTDFVLENHKQLHKKLSENYDKLDIPKSYDLNYNYANFLKKPLTLGMFVPCGENWNILEVPNLYEDWVKDEEFIFAIDGEGKRCLEYHTAKGRVLFEDCISVSNNKYFDTKRILVDLKTNSGFVRIYQQFDFMSGETKKEFMPNFSFIPNIEFLTTISDTLKLTETAKKQIGL